MACPPFGPGARIARTGHAARSAAWPCGTRRLVTTAATAVGPDSGLTSPVRSLGLGPTGGRRHRRPRPAASEGGLSTTSSTKLSTRTGVRRTSVRNEREPVQRPAPDEPEARADRPGCQRLSGRARGPRTGRRRGAGCRRGRPSRRATRRPPRRRSRPRSPPCSRGTSGSRSRAARSSIGRAGPDAAALGELDVDAGDDAHEGRRGPRGRRTLSSATMGSGERSWSQREIVVGARAGNGCSMSSTPSSTSSGRSVSASSRVQPVLASTRIGPAKTSRTARASRGRPGRRT